MSERESSWIDEFPGSVTVAGRDGTILYMNDAAARSFAKSGGRSLIGSDLAACHNAKANAKIGEIMEAKRPNAYTIEKGGARKLIYQAPWYESGEVAGVVEFSLEIPAELPHFKRD